MIKLIETGEEYDLHNTSVPNIISAFSQTRFNVILYTKSTGECLVEDYIKTLYKSNKKLANKVLFKIQNLAQYGIINSEETSLLHDGIFEIRIKQASNISRIFYFFRSGNNIVLTHGITKDSQKTDPKEINKAISYRKDYLEREGK